MVGVDGVSSEFGSGGRVVHAVRNVRSPRRPASRVAIRADPAQAKKTDQHIAGMEEPTAGRSSSTYEITAAS